MPAPEFAALVRAVIADFGDVAVWWQVAVLGFALGAAWVIAARTALRVRSGDRAGQSEVRRFGRHGLLRIVFPLSALILVVAARAVLDNFHNVSLLNLAVPLLLSLAVIRVVVYAVRQAVGRGSWVAAFERLFAALAWGVVALHILGWLPGVVAALDALAVSVGGQRLSLWMLMQGVALVALSLVLALWLAGELERRLTTAAGVDQNVRLVLLRVVKAALVLVAILVALPMVGIDLTTLSVFGGALGVGLGFGLQKIAANYVSGFIILLDRSIRIGNMISVGNERGVVREITTRYTVVRAPNGIEALVPNETLVGSVVQNETFSDSKVAMPLLFQIAYGADVEQAMAILVAVAAEQPRVLSDPPPKAFLTGFGDNGINLRLGCWIGDPQEGTLGISSAINLEVWRRFRQAGIEIPYPQREVRLLPSAAELSSPGAVTATAPPQP